MSHFKPSKRKKVWSESIGPYGHRVRLYEDPRSGIIYGEMRDPSRSGHYRCVSLRHWDRERAIAWAHQQVNEWMERGEHARTQVPTLARILSLYLERETPAKCVSEQQADTRRAKLWARVLGPQKDLSRLTLREWNEFIEARRSGRIDSEGIVTPADQREPVRDSTVGGDLTFLVTVCHWARRWKEEDRRLLPGDDPTLGLPRPKEKNPRRPLVTDDRFERVRAASDNVMMVRGRGKTARVERSYLSEVLDIAHGTGRRISAILALRYQDVRWQDGNPAAIQWPADTDKLGKESLVPVNGEVRRALNRIFSDRPGIGGGCLFPAVNDHSIPIATETVAQWLLKAEALAGLPKQDGSLFHAYRRGWATARKHLPIQDVMAAGGWSEPTTLQTCYQQPDEATLLRVVSEPAELRSGAQDSYAGPSTSAQR